MSRMCTEIVCCVIPSAIASGFDFPVDVALESGEDCQGLSVHHKPRAAVHKTQIRYCDEGAGILRYLLSVVVAPRRKIYSNRLAVVSLALERALEQ